MKEEILCITDRVMSAVWLAFPCLLVLAWKGYLG
jgi:hypothetical protein